MERLDGGEGKDNSMEAAQLQRPLYSMLEPSEEALVDHILAQVTNLTEQLGSNPCCRRELSPAWTSICISCVA